MSGFRMLNFFSLLMAGFLLVSMTVRADAAQDLRGFAEQSTEELMARLAAEQSRYQKDPEAFYKAMDDALAVYVDFRRIAARVMGRYARQASSEQRQVFVEKFKRSLFDAYAKALAETKDYSAEVSGVQINPNNDARATLDVAVSASGGKRYQVSYSVYKNDADRWMIENVIVEGVNIGLAFRERFERDMETHRGDIQAAINAWSVPPTVPAKDAVDKPQS